MGVKYVNGKAVYTIDKGTDLNHEAKINNSKIQNSEKRTKALTKEYKKTSQKALKTAKKQNKKKKKKEQKAETEAKRAQAAYKAIVNKSGITGGYAQRAANYRKENPVTKQKKKTSAKKDTSKNLTSNEALLLQNLSRTGSKNVVKQGVKNAEKTLRTSKAKTDDYKNLSKKTEKKKSKPSKQLSSNESLLVQNLTRTGTPNVVNKGLKGAEKTLRTSKAKTNEYKDLNKKVAKQDEKFLNSSPFAYGFMSGTSPIPLKETLELQTGRKIDTSKAEKSVGYKAGYMTGLAAEYATTGGIARDAVQQSIKTALKQAGKKAGKEAVKGVAKDASKQIAKNSTKLTEIGKRVLPGMAADTITGVPTNALEAGKEASKAPKGEKGKEFAKSLAVNTAFDVGMGVAGEAIPAAIKAAKATKASRSSYIPANAVPKESKKVYKEYTKANNEQIADYVKKVENKNQGKQKFVEVTKVNKPNSDKINELTGVDTTGYTVKLRGQTLEQHIAPRHGANGKADKSMADINDLSRMGYIIDNADRIDYVYDKNGRPKVSREYTNKDGSRANLIMFEKKIDGHYYVVTAVPDTKDKALQVVSSYIKKAGQTGNEKNLSQYVRNASETTTFSDSVAPSATDVKPLDERLSVVREAREEVPKASENISYENMTQPEIIKKAEQRKVQQVAMEKSALEKDLGADINRNKPKYKESTAAVNEVRPEGEKFMYETETHAQREQAAKDRLATDYDAEYKDLMSKDEYTSEDLATMGELLKREKDNFSRFHKLTQKAGEVSSRKGQELEAVKHIKENTAAGKAIKAEQASRKSIKQMEKANPLKLKQTDTQAKETIEEIGKAVDTAIDKTFTEYNSKQLSKEINNAIKEAGIDIKEVMKQSKTAKTDAKNVVVDAITKKLREAGVDDESIKAIADDVGKTFDAKLDEAAKKYLTQKFAPKKAGKKEKNTMIENVMELIHMGAYDDEDIVNLMRAKNGVNVLTPQQTKQIVDYMDIYEANPNTREGKEALAKANKIIANLEGSDFGDKFRSVQRIAMLFNPKTWLSRNAGGNLLLMGAENIKDIPASVIDTLVSLKTGERTTAGITRAKLKAQGKGLKEGFKEQLLDIRHGVDTAHARTKYEMPNKDVWKNKPMQKLDTLIGQLLQLGDRPFYEAAYKARKAELENFVKKGKSKLTAEEIEAEAKYFALDRVFQADTSIAEAANYIRKGLNKMSGGIGGNIVLPFTQTPSNIIAKLLDYSPAGLLKAVKELSKTRKGTFNQKVFVDTLGRTFTGAGVITLGYVLANKKLMTVDLYAQSGKDQQTQKAYEKQGLQSYAINLDPETSFTIDWANPIGSLLILGAEAYYGGANQEDFITALFGGGEAAVDSVFNQSFLQGLQTLFSSREGSIAEGIGKTMLSATTQPLPSVIQQLTRIVDPSKRETYDENTFQRQLNVLMSKTPYLSTKLPEKKDVTGQTVEQFQGRSTASKIFEAYLNPANISQRQYNSVNDEAVRVYEATGEKGALLRVTDDKDFKYDGATYKLKNAAEVSRFQEVQGKYAYEELSKLMNSSKYRGKSDSEKAEMIRKVTLKAREKAEEDYLIKNEGYTQTQLDFNKLSDSKREKYKNTNMTKSAYIDAINKANTYNADGEGPLKQDEFKKYVRENGISSSVARQLWTVYGWKASTNPY